MKPWELYKHIWNVEYVKSGFDFDWRIEVDDTEHKIRLLFAPSNSVKDWIVNIGGFTPVLKGGLVYCYGWKEVFDRTKWPILWEVVHELHEHKGYTVEISGHSYGGAEAINAAIELYKRMGIKADVITFGAPRPLFLLYSKIIARFCIRSITQYAHWSDIVTFCPPFLGYHNIKVHRLGKFTLKGLFKPEVYHLSYGEPKVYGIER